MIHPIEPKYVNTNSKFFILLSDMCVPLNSAGHTTKDCTNMKHKIQDLTYHKVVTSVCLSYVHNNSLPNHGGDVINTIELEEDWGATKMIVPSNLDSPEKVVAFISISKKPDLVIIKPHKDYFFWD